MRLSAATVAFVVVVVVVCQSWVADGRSADRRLGPRNCGEANMCCQGQNNTCFVFGLRVDMSNDSDRCYCDSNCLIMGDCCTDYHHVCRSVDCEVSDWTMWSDCDNPCGYGSRRRVREVQLYPEHGGKHCPVLKQRRACVGYNKEVCLQQSVEYQAEELAEKGRILPISFGIARSEKKYNPWRGILKNLYDKYFNEIFTRATYRGKYRITSTHFGCDSADFQWANILKVNQEVCVECQPVAMNRKVGMRCLGHGVMHQNTTWTAVDVPHCHGTWEMVENHNPKTCDYDIDTATGANFIFI